MVDRLQLKWQRLIGMRIALWLDKRHPEWCWASLCVNIGMGWHLFGGKRWHTLKTDECHNSCARTGSCWCGKIRDPKREEEFFAELQARQ